ncbi:halogenase [Streptomyces sp. NBRC 14336]|uniref:NAD(P)/FAD-dependent oxidoreductase n=1 Tax=Streptomyces sp. NBRC 14336 TaxID=3030992 RepID=UPI00249F9568|nr:NAD(P)/FAD-dependent oxidoreductase [Streptomyces sp. NBRC 14336]WBO80946.1 NAD(P)/FAD-dependent oxidoreductase [Streptomyces sp. SBE_14.2]GLW48207.1 halogenase [Streptomyces sp. NBRC 14336]
MPTRSKHPTSPQYDVAILGSGLAGTTLAACLARNGAKVLVLDAGTHPRFAIGESTIPYTSMLMRLVSERYGVPEIKWLTTFESVQSKISTNCGVKRNFGFLYHREGARQNPLETNEFPIPKITHTENHFFRQDVDAWMLTVAIKYGAEVRQQTKIVDAEFDDDGVTVIPTTGDPVRVKFLVDASGHRSPLAEKFGLREEPSRLRHQSRSLFTHMIGVKPWEETVPKGSHKNPSPWSQGTLHHMFEGGWMWVIPFNNHPRATNPLCSVGLNLDPRIHPVPDCSPEEEFRRFIAKYPDIAPQFEGAITTRDWVRTERLQYSSKQTVGYRWCLTSHAAGFVDALFSRGLSNTMEIIHALTWRLLDAIKDDDFAVERFEYVQELEQGLLDFNDDLVANAYTSTKSWFLWNAYYRSWVLGQALATFEINRAYAWFLEDHDPKVLERLERQAPDGAIPDYAPLRELLKGMSEAIQDVQHGRREEREAADHIMTLLGKADYIPPVFGLADPDNHWTDVTPVKLAKTLHWSRTRAPKEIGDLTWEGLTLFMKKRFDRDEFQLAEELKHTVAGWPVIGRAFRVPEPE